MGFQSSLCGICGIQTDILRDNVSSSFPCKRTARKSPYPTLGSSTLAFRSVYSSSAFIASCQASKPSTKPEQAEDIIRSFVHQFDTTDLPSIWDPELESLCMKEVEHRGYALEALQPYLVTGLNIAASAYHHIDDVNIKVYIAIYTAFAIYFDDAYPDDPDALVGVPKFTKVNVDVYIFVSEIPLTSSMKHFASSEKQPTKMLDDFAGVLAEASQLFGEVTADFIVQAVLRFMTALILEIRSKSEPRHKVDKYTMFLRELSGIAEAYAVFIFPAELPYSVYIQTLPLLRDVICFINDIVSFYKEEADGENYNLISMLAEANDEPKTKTLRNMVGRCMETHERALLLLSPHKDAHGMYKEFVKGYLAYHLGAKRYRLNELNM
ncbi:isoprenoid synthase domain-containing protein [Armillaria borealis]|uniref:Isoprenoid synthase domain-containing protein n=1 Tax=Armillaria borealis TaxID=47425 RepID=A0AA39MNE4_9AGAR|nr:isoprenoid synthase domain-containing protein [Armillaria borealis]